MQNVVIVNAGSRGKLSAEAGSYDSMVDYLNREINQIMRASNPEEHAATAKVVTSVDEAKALLDRTDVLIFVTAGLTGEATRIKKAHPRLKVVVFTGLLAEDEVIMVDKRWMSVPVVRDLVIG